MARPRIFFYVQHLLGIGHLRRAALISRAMADMEMDVDLVMGGMPVPDLDAGSTKLHRLPPLRIGDGGFHDLLDEAGHPADEEWKAERRDRLLALYDDLRPDMVLTEAFPFGRRQMRFELLPLLERAVITRPRPPVVCSVRDILKSDRKPGRAEETVDLIARYYDAVLSHGDPSFATLDETFREARRFAEKISYTGMVSRNGGGEIGSAAASGEVVVSAGGGAVGEKLLSAAIDARPLTRCAASQWRLLAGPNLAEDAFDALRTKAGQGMLVERYRPDFPALLTRCAVSVSQAGYNTVCDLMVAGARAVLVPFDAEGEDEQPARAGKLAALGLAQVVRSADLTPARLAEAIDRALEGRPMSAGGLDLNGAATTAETVRRLLDAGTAT